MAEQNNGGPAFPVTHSSVDSATGAMKTYHVEANWTVRDEFAARAMLQPDALFASLFSGRWAAWIAYRRADAMLAARG